MDVREAARERCKNLLSLARATWSKDEVLARRYVSIARKLAMRHCVRLGSREYCKKCLAPFIPGVTLRVRASGKTVLYVCQACNNVKRFPYSKRK